MRQVKTFEARWGDGYIHTQTKVITQQAINEANGYEDADVQAIDNLAVGEKWHEGTAREHTIERLS
jgi:hypothetical protein